MLIVALVFVVTWVVPNQIITVLLIQFPDADDGAALKSRSTMLLGAFAEERLSTWKSLAGITAQLNSCLNFFIYAFRHKNFRQHLRLMCGADNSMLKTTFAAPSAKIGTLMPPTEARVIRY